MNTKTFERVKEHRDFVKKYIEEFHSDAKLIAVCLYGSQNYHLDTEESDIDTKAFYLPSKDELMFGQPISKELHLPNGEHCELKSIFTMYSEVCKGSPNMLEAICSEYKVVEKGFQNRFFEICHHIDEYDRINKYRTIRAMIGLAVKRGGKDYHKPRLHDMVVRYINGEPFKDILVPSNLEYIRKVKSGEIEADIESIVETLVDISHENTHIIRDEEKAEDFKKFFRPFYD